MIYESPEMCIMLFEYSEVITSSFIENGGVGQDGELNLDDFKPLTID